MTTKKILSVIYFLFVIDYLQAQDKVKNFIGLSTGVSVPTGEFAKTDVGSFGAWNNTSGFAKTSFNIGVDGAYYFLKRLGIAGTITYSDHGALNASDVSKLAQGYQQAFDVDQDSAASSGRYKALNVMLGPILSLPCKKFIFDFRAMAGILKSFSTPQINSTLTDASINYPFSQLSSTASAFGLQAGVGVRYALTETWALSLKADYFYSSGVKITNENRKNNAGRLETKQEMSWVNVSAGIAYTFK